MLIRGRIDLWILVKIAKLPQAVRSDLLVPPRHGPQRIHRYRLPVQISGHQVVGYGGDYSSRVIEAVRLGGRQLPGEIAAFSRVSLRAGHGDPRAVGLVAPPGPEGVLRGWGRISFGRRPRERGYLVVLVPREDGGLAAGGRPGGIIGRHDEVPVVVRER